MIAEDFWMHHHADGKAGTEEFEDTEFDLAAELARIEAEAEAEAERAASRGAGPVGEPAPRAGGADGPTDALADDWEPLP